MVHSVKPAVSVLGKFEVAISAAASGVNALVAAVASRKIRVTSLFLVADGAVTAQFRSAANNITGAMSFAANGGIVLPYNKNGWFTTEINEALNVNLGGAVGIRGALTYDLVA